MKLSSLFVQGNQSYIEGNGKDTDALAEGLKNGMKEIIGKVPGQTITGEILEKNGNELLISIGKNQLLRAKLDGNIQVESGGQMSFAIKALTGSKVILSPLFANTGNDPNVSKALQMAGIPETEETVKMVQTMMKEGMPVDKNSLQQMMRIVNLNPGKEMETMVQLTRLQIPVTEDSIFQMDAYKNYQHQMSDALITIADTLPETLQQMVSEGNSQGGITLYKEIITMLSGENDGIIPKSTASLQPQAVDGKEVFGLNTEQQNDVKAVGADSILQPATGEEGILSVSEREHLAAELKQAGFEQLSEAFQKGNLTEKELLSGLSTLLSDKVYRQEEQTEALVRTLSGKEFHKLIKNEMKNEWLLLPEEVAEEGKVEKLYERLNQQMNKIEQVLEQTAKSGTSLGKAITNVSSNIDFMNQLNQMFHYVQLPLKLQGREVNSELYIYTNKKNLARKDGEVSALLHLDMEHLGSMDVHVTLKDAKVSTKFYLQDDKDLDLIAAHIDLLNQRLEKRGYLVSASFETRKDPQNVMEEILKENKNISLLSGYSFDARA